MNKKGGQEGSEKGVSARQLMLVFLLGVAVCAVFFSMGFLVGYHERFSRAAPITEQVTAPRVVPPTVNPPLATPSPLTKQPAAELVSPGQLPAGAKQQIASEVIPESKQPAAPASRGAAPPPQNPASNPGSSAGVEPVASLPAAGQEVGASFTIQVAASATQQEAEAQVTKLKARGYSVFLVTPEYARAHDNLFRVQVGPFPSRDEAEKVRQKLLQDGFKQPFIRR